MSVPNSRRMPCPRCGAPVTGDFKFCPTCAYRLREAEPWQDEDEDTTPGGRWPQVVVALLLGLLMLGILGIGFRLFSEPEPDVPTPPGPEEGLELSVQNILELMVTIPPDYAGWWPAPDPTQEDLPVHVPWFSRILTVEVTRGMYAEFVEACRQDPTLVPAWLERHWRPVAAADPAAVANPLTEPDTLIAQWWALAEDARALYQAEEYISRWWALFEEHDRARLEARGEEDTPGVERPEDFHAPLPARHGSILLVPPSWAYLTPFLELHGKLPEGTESLPVTEVSWYDASAFAEWASGVVGKELRLPFDMEWVLAANGGEPGLRFPWGNGVHWYACNSLNFWSEGQTPRLLPADRPYYDDGDGRTKDGIRAMSGNAREWTRNHAFEYVPAQNIGSLRVVEHWRLVVATPVRVPEDAPTLGGSYLNGIQDCQIDRTARREEKIGRWVDVGFRLWTEGDPMSR